MNKQINTSLSTFLIFGIFLLLNSYFHQLKQKPIHQENTLFNWMTLEKMFSSLKKAS